MSTGEADERLQVTAEDIAAQAANVTTPPVLTIGVEDLPANPPAYPVVRRHAIQITADDIAAFEPAGEEVVSRLEQLMYDLLVGARAEHMPRWLGRAQLKWHPILAQAARRHSNDMLLRNYVAHVTPEGINVAQRLDRLSISYLACGENIGVVYGPASHGDGGVHEIHNAFMNQPRRLTNHRGNILNPVWTHVGIGVAYAPEGRLIVTENFVSTLTNPVPEA